MIDLDKPKRDPENTVYLSILSNLLWYSRAMQTPFLFLQTNFCFLSDALTQKHCLMVMLKRESLFFLQFLKHKQLETIPTTNRSHMLNWQLFWKSLSNLEKTSRTWHICLNVWLTSVTLIHSLFCLSKTFSHNFSSSYIKNEMSLIVYCKIKYQEERRYKSEKKLTLLFLPRKFWL